MMISRRRRGRLIATFSVTVATMYGRSFGGVDLSLLERTGVPPPVRPGDAAGPTLNGQGPCLANPYAASVDRPFDEIIDESNDWLDGGRHLDLILADHSNYTGHDHMRFFPFRVDAPCRDLQCVGGECSDDDSKIVCGMDRLARLENCTVYSIGSHNRWQFEEDLLRRTRCKVHTFDCTGRRGRFVLPPHEEGRLAFHHVCLGARGARGEGDDSPGCAGTNDYNHLCGDTMTLGGIQRALGHRTVDLLKMDIEGWEWPVLDAPTPAENASMPMQVLAEVHYDWRGHGTRGVVHDGGGTSSARDLVRMRARLARMGYAVAHRDDNPHCRHCSELTLVRVAC